MVGGQEDIERLSKFIAQLKKDFNYLRFREGERFAYRGPRTIILEPTGDYDNRVDEYMLSTLHEVGHALLEHKFYQTDPERLKMESEAWEKAKELCLRYGVMYDTECVEEKLDTYRDWLHQKSCCPRCGLTRYQTRDGKYHCPSCQA